MGYSTDFEGTLFFTEELRATQIAFLDTIMDEDVRDHPEWGDCGDAVFIDLKFTADYDGLEWNGAENTYGMVDAVNLIIREMQKKWMHFGLSGFLNAQGEDMEDRWRLEMVDGIAVKIPVAIDGEKQTCPHCHKSFLVAKGIHQ